MCVCRMLYWTDFNKIYRSSVVSPARETLVTGDLVRPNAFAVDFTGIPVIPITYLYYLSIPGLSDGQIQIMI